MEFLVDSGSSVAAMSDSLYQTLVQTGAPVGALGYTLRTLRGANGTRIGVSGCSHYVVSFIGLQTEFPILVCNLATGTDAIIGTDVLGSVLPHTLDIKNGLMLTEGGASLQLHRQDSALSGRVFTDAIQWFIGGTNTIHREYRSDCGQNSGGSVAMESSGPRIKFQSGYRHGGSILRGGNDSSSLCYSVHYRAILPTTG